MFPKSGTRFPKATTISETDFMGRIGAALKDELGSTRQATKTVMRWTMASDRTARNWLNGAVCPSALHFILLARSSPAIWSLLLELADRHEAQLAEDLHAIEVALAQASGSLERLRRHRIHR